LLLLAFFVGSSLTPGKIIIILIDPWGQSIGPLKRGENFPFVLDKYY